MGLKRLFWVSRRDVNTSFETLLCLLLILIRGRLLFSDSLRRCLQFLQPLLRLCSCLISFHTRWLFILPYLLLVGVFVRGCLLLESLVRLRNLYLRISLWLDYSSCVICTSGFFDCFIMRRRRFYAFLGFGARGQIRQLVRDLLLLSRD